MKRTPTALLLEAKLGEPLAGFVAAHRADERSWGYIARKLQERTDVSFSKESLRLWFAEDDETAGRAA